MTKQSFPWVTVICTSYNHAPFVERSLASVLTQTYKKVELIVVDNASSDESTSIIRQFLLPYPQVKFYAHAENKGICKSFNDAAREAKGKYLIDLAADDLLMPERIAHQVARFEQLDDRYAVLYGNVELIDANGRSLGSAPEVKSGAPSGDLFAGLLEKHFVPSPSTIFRASAFHALNGYNEALAFEDFDYWIRCARLYLFYYEDTINTKKRVLPNSLTTQFYGSKSEDMLTSTYATFEWAHSQLRSTEEKKAFIKGASYYFRQCVWMGHFGIAKKFIFLIQSQKMGVGNRTLIAQLFLLLQVCLKPLYLIYLRMYRLVK